MDANKAHSSQCELCVVSSALKENFTLYLLYLNLEESDMFYIYIFMPLVSFCICVTQGSGKNATWLVVF